MKGFNQMMKQAQEIQAKVLKAQKEVESQTVEAEAGGGMVKVVANGRQRIVEIKIDPEVVNPDDIEMLQDLVTAAVNKAMDNAQEMVAQAINKVTGNLKIPGF
ncbi:MAG: YbaB/EbfC family nucleoid-associated protein [bacterium]|nr:YbaB/EbfC family nucleoid-associated protein [bacterium]